jgi:tRNA G46 methylase TrmB
LSAGRGSSFDDLFAPGEVHRLVIHHPDPWSSPSKAKHRLIRPEFLARAAELVAGGGELRLKTDFLPHRDALLAGLPGTPWRLVGTSDDVLANGAPWPDDIVTGYQGKFNKAGLPVYAALLSRSGGTES